MAESIEARLARAQPAEGCPRHIWNEAFRSNLKREGLMVAWDPSPPEGSVMAPDCVPYASYGWIKGSIIVERAVAKY